MGLAQIFIKYYVRLIDFSTDGEKVLTVPRRKMNSSVILPFDTNDQSKLCLLALITNSTNQTVVYDPKNLKRHIELYKIVTKKPNAHDLR